MNTAVIAVGSNIEPERNVERARRELERAGLFRSASGFVRTAPIGPAGQPDFLNGAFLVETALARPELKGCLRDIERLLGRHRTAERYGPREIDLDIVVWNGQVVSQDYNERDFVRRAVLELLPDLEKAGRADSPV